MIYSKWQTGHIGFAGIWTLLKSLVLGHIIVQLPGNRHYITTRQDHSY